MNQYHQLKAKHPDAILLFRVGDFYETFGEDAIKTSRALGIVLTSRNNGGNDVELAGFPFHALDLYLPKLVKSGYRVAICEQLEKPVPGKKIVKRGITEIVTPGIKSDEKLLDFNANNYLASIHFDTKGEWGIAFLDISTGEFLTSQGSKEIIEKLIQNFSPSEIIFSKSFKKQFEKLFDNKFYAYPLDEWVFTFDFCRENLLEHFEVNSMKGFAIEDMEAAQIASGTILHYLKTTENKNLRHINSIQRIYDENYMWLDRFTIKNLELINPQYHSGATLIKVLDKTTSPMGARLLKKWLLLPLVSPKAINQRLEMVDFFVNNMFIAEDIIHYLKKIGDLERLISKVSLGKVNPRELLMLNRSLHALIHIREILENTDHEHLKKIGSQISLCDELRNRLTKELMEDAPVSVAKGNVISAGISPELDELRYLINHNKEVLNKILESEIQRTGIDKLKIGFNNVFGYFLEVTNRYKEQVPDNWIRKQTLTSSERYISPELKELESKILSAEEKILVLEEKLFQDLITDTMNYIISVQHNASLLSRIDVLISYAFLAVKNQYVKPEVNDSLLIEIRDGRHPVIEQYLEPGDNYVPNDIYLSNDDNQILMITGPNMSGKSAILRQTALIVLMAQIGSFVPASSAHIGYIDKLFTRVGASDNISSGESTFMVEMNETSNILNNVSDRSLVVLDEIGRGTSTYDGISIAWALTEFLHENAKANPKTLFATHYHELNELEPKFKRIKNFNVATKEIGNKVIFLRKLVKGGSKHSFGIHVARMSGMPRSIIDRAYEVLEQLEQKMHNQEYNDSDPVKKLKDLETKKTYQLSIFDAVDETGSKLKEQLSQLNLNTMTPIECMLKLNELKKIIEDQD
ncbi:MAG: DNA mismatch repair protein MutS [Saprospiraceae bacterium]|nr:DNA mismatch repair protein MutS [Saprospiraceae bacterium]